MPAAFAHLPCPKIPAAKGQPTVATGQTNMPHPVIFKLPLTVVPFTRHQLATVKGITATPEFVDPSVLSRHDVRR